ncbi:MAG: hypothetical protein K2H64_10810, partial [Desulfovibrio sp.]|nr:hypothetical protein [Desulfovibrio sp.]
MSVAHRSDGRWLVRYKDKDSHEWKQKTFRDEQTARAWEESYLKSVNLELDNDRLTLGELVMLYFRSNPDKHPRTKKRIVNLLAGHENSDGVHIPGACESLRDKYAESLNRSDLERLREIHRQKGASNNTINKYQVYIRAILAWGVDQDLIRINPWRDYKRLKTQKGIINVNVEDLKRLYSHLPEYLQWAVKTAFFLALRPGLAELSGLTWDAFNWRRGIVVIRQGK